jgi:hypothetical protein
MRNGTAIVQFSLLFFTLLTLLNTQVFCSNFELQKVTKLNIFITTSLNIQQFLRLFVVRMAQVVEQKAGNSKVKVPIPHFGVVCFSILLECNT